MASLPQNLTDLTAILALHNITLHPAGVWEFDPQGKKSPVDAYRVDNLNLADYPNDNMLKLKLSGELLVIDVDSVNPEIVELTYPTIKDTLYTTTTTPNKRHYYLLAPEGKEWTRTRDTQNGTGIDYLTNGIVFEGHLFDQPNTHYSIHNTDIATATLEEYAEIELSLQKHPATAEEADLTEYVSKELRNLVILYIKEPLETADHNRLCRLLMNQAYRVKNKGRRGRLEITPKYDNMNTIAVKLSCNIAIPTTLRDEFITAWLKNEWDFSRTSRHTVARLDKCILPSLPIREAIDVEATTLEERLDDIVEDGFALASTIVSGTHQYLQIDPQTMKPRRTGKDGGFLISKNGLPALFEDKEQMDMAIYYAPLITIMDNPYKGITEWDGEQRIDYFNVANRTEYERESRVITSLPDNPLTRAIASYFGEHAELYLHWLAHTVLAPNSPILIPFLVSTKDDAGGTGKTLCATTIPTALAYAVSTISPQTMTSDWGDATSANRLVALNDIPKMSDSDWNDVYGKMRDETSQGMRRKKNMKYAGFVEVTDAYAISVSANWIPKLDAHDRRAWVIPPQHLEYGDTEPVSIEDQRWLDVFAQSHLDTRYEELSDLMAYLRYLYSEDRFKEELYRKAPETKGRDMAVSKGTTYSSRILYSMQVSPDTLFELMEEDEVQFAHSSMQLNMTPDNTATQQQIAQVIVMQYYSGKVFLPKDFLAEVQQRVVNSDTIKYTEKHTTLAKLCDALAIEKEKFKQTAKDHHFTHERVTEAGLPIRMANYPQRMISFIMGEPQLELWKEVANGH